MTQSVLEMDQSMDLKSLRCRTLKNQDRQPPRQSRLQSAIQVLELSMLKVKQDLLSKLEDLSADSETLDRLNRLRM